MRLNITRYVPLHQAHELAIRLNEMSEAIRIVEQCGCSPELTEAVNRLGKRMQSIQKDLEAAITEANDKW